MSTPTTCFVLMPFDNCYKEVYHEVYQPVCKANEITCWRVDEVKRPGSITKDIIEGIFDADIIIADLTSRNPNVFYELGIAHAVGNKTIMIAQSLKDVPFDIASYRVIIYEQTTNGKKHLHEKLDGAIKELLQVLDQANNPFQEVAATRSFLVRKGKTPLAKYVDFTEIPSLVRQYLQNKEIVFVEDLERLDFEDMISTQGIGKGSMEKLLSQILKNNLFKEARRLQEFIMKHRLNATGRTLFS